MDLHVKSVLEQVLPYARHRVERIAREEDWPYDLQGLCGRATAIIHQLLNLIGFDPIMCIGTGHIFSMIDDYVVDVTASQFDLDDILIRSHQDLLLDKYNFRGWNPYETKFRSKNLIAVITRLEEMGWTQTQRPRMSEYLSIPGEIYHLVIQTPTKELIG